jgi:ADYC domain
VTDKWKFITGTQFVGASINGVLSDGSTLPLRVDDVSKGAGSTSDVWFYDVSYRTDEGWFPLCGTDAAGEPLAAIPLAGTWDYSEGTRTGGSWSSSSTTFTFACRLNALAKCVEMGYKPWATVNGTSLRNHHQACTRLIRADYCGNGRSWTLDGRMINLYDSLGIQTDTDRWTFEAEWKPDGARCLSGMRVIDLKNVFGVVDQCVLAKALVSPLSCGSKSHFSSGTLLMNEYRDLNLLGLINL